MGESENDKGLGKWGDGSRRGKELLEMHSHRDTANINRHREIATDTCRVTASEPICHSACALCLAPSPRGFGWRIHCGVEVNELSTNKQYTLSFNEGRGR